MSIFSGKHRLFVGKFLTQINTTRKVRASSVISFHHTNAYLAKKYNIVLVDEIPHHKHMHMVEEISPHMDDVMTTPIGKDIYNHLRFHPNIASPPLTFVTTILKSHPAGRTNVVHLRLESDGITHWSKMNDMTADSFRDRLTDKYIAMISKHVSKTDPTFVLTGDEDNPVIDYMKTNGYHYHIFKKPNRYREINAIMDMVIGRTCTNVFIGAGGSTFSQLLNIYLTNVPSTHLLDLNHID